MTCVGCKISMDSLFWEWPGAVVNEVLLLCVKIPESWGGRSRNLSMLICLFLVVLVLSGCAEERVFGSISFVVGCVVLPCVSLAGSGVLKLIASLAISLAISLICTASSGEGLLESSLAMS